MDSTLPGGIRRDFAVAFGKEAPVTGLELVLKTNAWTGDAANGRHLQQLKQRVFDMKPGRFLSVDVFEFEGISTSLDNVFGEPLMRGEVISLEGGTGTGKTRLLVKLAHEVAVAGTVIYIDADLALQENVVTEMRESLGISSPEVGYDEESDAPLVIPVVSSILDLYPTINNFCRRNSPDLIIIDGLASLLQSAVMVDGPGSAMLQELALELKSLARAQKCSIIVTNALRTDQNPPQPFLGRLYASLWHTRLQLIQTAADLVRCDLVTSPRLPPQSTTLVLDTLECL